MPQLTIDPCQLGQPAASNPITLLPHSAREFGHVPDLGKCLPGDLILFKEPKPGWTSRTISSSQLKAGFASEDSAWTHAAVYLEDALIVEAVRAGVVIRSLYVDVPSRILRIRRQTSLAEVDRYRIALRALRMVNARYSTMEALKLGLQMSKGLWDRAGSKTFGRVVICSKVFHDAYAEVTRSFLDGCPIDSAATPAHLSATRSLDDVDVPWLKLP